MHKRATLVLTLAAILAGCGGRPDEKVDRDLQNGNYAEAITFLEQELKDDPRDPLLNALLAEVLVAQCAFEQSCAALPLSSGEKLNALLTPVDGAIKISGDVRRDPYTNIEAILSKVEPPQKQLALVVSVLASLPENAPKDQFAQMLITQAASQMTALDYQTAKQRLKAVTLTLPDTFAAYHMAALLLALSENNTSNMASYIRFLQNQQPTLNDGFIRALPYAMYAGATKASPQNGALLFADQLGEQMDKMALPQLQTQTSKALLAEVMLNLTNDEAFMSNAVGHIRTTISTPETHNQTPEATAEAPVIQGLETPELAEATLIEASDETLHQMLALRLLKQSLVFNPDQPEVWKQFLQPAMNYVDQTGDTDLLFAGINQSKIPSEELGPYNKRLFDGAEQKLRLGENMLPLLEKVVVPEEKGGAVERRINELVEAGLTQALEKEEVDKLVAYATFRPDVAKPMRQQIVNLSIKGMESMWRNNAFENMEAYATFLTQTMEIDFNLDSLLLQNFATFMAESKLLEQLNAETTDILVNPQDEAVLNLGAKFAYLQQHFAKNREPLDNQLKTFVAEAKGLYGTPTALYRLYPLFDDTAFPPRERQEYLVGSLKKALLNDKSLDAPQFAHIGRALSEQHPGITMLFVIGETLNRIETLEQARAVWDSMDTSFKANVQNIRPQFATLMQAIELFEGGEKGKAAQLFSIISDKQYLLQAEPYFTAYQNMLENHQGVFASTNTDKNMHTLLLFVAPARDIAKYQAPEVPQPQPEAPMADVSATEAAPAPTPAPAEATPAALPSFNSENMLEVDITLINALGTVLVRSHMQLVEDYGQTFRYTLRGKLNPDTMELSINEQQRAAAQLPQSFERIFGALNRLRLNEDGSITAYVESQKKGYQFHKIQNDVTRPLFPRGRYGITEQVSKPDPDFDHVLPVGSILEVAVDPDTPMQPVQDGKTYAVVYPMKGQLWHPAATEPRPIKGYYSLNTHIITFRYSYPYGTGGGKLDAVAKCQLVDTGLVCAAYNTQWSRRRFNHIVKGLKAAGDVDVEFDNSDTLLPPPIID